MISRLTIARFQRHSGKQLHHHSHSQPTMASMAGTKLNLIGSTALMMTGYYISRAFAMVTRLG